MTLLMVGLGRAVGCKYMTIITSSVFNRTWKDVGRMSKAEHEDSRTIDHPNIQ